MMLAIFLVCLAAMASQVQAAKFITSADKTSMATPSSSKPVASSTPPLFLSDQEISQMLSWDTLVPAIESVMVGVVKDTVIQPARLVMRIPDKDAVVLSMPGYVRGANQTATPDDPTLAVKIVTAFTKNKDLGLPSILATVLLYDPNTGKLKAVMEGAEITKWRTAGASVVATKHLFKRSGQKGLVLAIMGSGAQAEIHARAFQHSFDLKKINIWNHRYAGAEALVQKLNLSIASAFQSGEECVRDADVIVTATYSSVPVVKMEWIRKSDVHINAVGAGLNHHSELDGPIYGNSSIFFDSEASAKTELKGLYEQFPGNMIGEVGQHIENQIKPVPHFPLTVFHSMGMASEDVITAKLIYEKYYSKNVSK